MSRKCCKFFENLIERDDNSKCSILPNMFSRKTIHSLDKETMLNHIFSNRPELFKYTQCAYSNSSYLFNRNSIIMSEEGTQQIDSEDPRLFDEGIQTLVKKSLNPKQTFDIYMTETYPTNRR